MKFQLKAFVPKILKQVPYYLFKAPQRQEGVSYTWMVELRGLRSFISKNIGLNHSKLEPISICTGNKNRNENFLDYVLPSILKMDHQELIEISIYDCGSDDVEGFEKAIQSQWKGKLVFRTEELPFSRSMAFNKAVEQATNELIFIADADMSLPHDLVKLCNRYVSKYSVWFPVVFDLNENAPASISKGNGQWLYEGKGMFASTKTQFMEAGMLNTKYKTWGVEDWDLWLRFFRAGFLPLRTRTKGMFHHWHPYTGDKLSFLEKLKEAGFK